MSMYMPSCGSLFTAARVMFSFACTLVVLLEQSEFFSFLSYQGSKGNGLGLCPLVRLEIASLLKFFRMRSCLFSLTHPKVNFTKEDRFCFLSPVAVSLTVSYPDSTLCKRDRSL